MFDVDISKGYVDMPVPEGIDLVSEIERMKREKYNYEYCEHR